MKRNILDFQEIKHIKEFRCEKEKTHVMEVETTHERFTAILVFLREEQSEKKDYIYRLYAPNMTKKSSWILKRALYHALKMPSLKENERRIWLDQYNEE
jgi:hypothetical protein